MRNLLIFTLTCLGCGYAQSKDEIARDHALRATFERLLGSDLYSAQLYLPVVIDKSWIHEVSFKGACALAQAVEEGPFDLAPAAMAERLILAVGLHNPELALRESPGYLGLEHGERMFEQFVHAAPDEAMGMVAGTSKPALAMREMMAASRSGEVALLGKLAGNTSIDMPRRRRIAIFASRIARGEISMDAALRLASDGQAFFSAMVDLRVSATGADVTALDRVLENEALVLCRAARERLQSTLASDLSRFRARDAYVLLALGRAEAVPEIFGPIFDRLVLPRWRAETPKGQSLVAMLDQTGNWELRDFVAGVVAAHRFEALLGIAGSELVGRLARGVDRTRDPLKEGMRLAEIAGATASAALLKEMAAIVGEEFARCQKAGDLRGATIYGLLAARLGMDGIAAPYSAYFRASDELDTAALFGAEKLCVERHFFYDDDDGVKSYESFKSTYEGDAGWEVAEMGEYLHVTGRGADGRRVEIFANVPIDGHLPKNQALEGMAAKRQDAITAVLASRGVTPTVIVHRGHSFWVERTIRYVAKSSRLVILGSCGGADQIHEVLGASHEAQVIATRGVGATSINDGILKAVNDRLLEGGVIEWTPFWREIGNRSKLFRDYLAPNQDASAVFLRAYYRYLDAAQ